jgi:hypothetical protein
LFADKFVAAAKYTLKINLTNPYYADIFQIEAYNSAVAFTAFSFIEIKAKNIQCFLEG